MADYEYEYSLQRGEVIVATGHILVDREYGVGDRLRLNGQESIVRSLLPASATRPRRLVVRLLER